GDRHARAHAAACSACRHGARRLGTCTAAAHGAAAAGAHSRPRLTSGAGQPRTVGRPPSFLLLTRRNGGAPMVNLARVSWLASVVLLTAGPVAGEPRQEARPTICSHDHGLQLALSAKAFLARTLLQVQLAPTQLAAFESLRAVFEGQVDKVR